MNWFVSYFCQIQRHDNCSIVRFTIAHELAHYILHRNGNKLYAHRDSDVEGVIKSSIEREANFFAANVLMPEKLIEEKVEDISKN